MSVSPQERVNPYVGLPPFESGDSLYFFGRERQTAELLERLRHTRLLAVVGSSGCGKSSLVRAGLIPALRGGFMTQQRDVWQIATMKPGGAPLRHLAAALLAGDGPPAPEADVVALVEKMEIYGADAVEELVRPRLGSRASLLLLLDQFEEIFARGKRMKPTPEADAFVALILDLAGRTDLPVFSVITMRSDFLGDCEAFPGLPEAMNRSCYLVPRLVREQMQEAIEGPALLKGTKLAPRLLDQLLNDASDHADQLPVLQHALSRTWQIWSDRGAKGEIERKDYEDAGTVEKAISRHADPALRGLDERKVARVLKCLVDTDLSGRRVRKGSTLGEIAAISGVAIAEVETILERFRADERYFVIVEADGPPAERHVEISHESLIRQWGKLRDWTDEERENRDHLLEYVKGARRWQRDGDRVLLRDLDLTIAIRWKTDFRREEAWASRYVGADDFRRALAFIEQSETSRNSRLRNRALLIIGLLAVIGAMIWLMMRQQKLHEQDKKMTAAAEATAVVATKHADDEARMRQKAEADAKQKAGELEAQQHITEHRKAITDLRGQIQAASKRLAAGAKGAVLQDIQTFSSRLDALKDAYRTEAQSAPSLVPVADEAARAAAEARIDEGRTADLLADWGKAEKAYHFAAAAAASRWSDLLGAAEEGLADVTVHKLGSAGNKVWVALSNDSIRKHYVKARDAYRRAGDVAGAVRASQEINELLPWGYVIDRESGTAWVLDNRYTKVVIGRRTPFTVAADIAIQDQYISRIHAVITRDTSSGKLTIEDMRSTNGSTLNGNKLEYGTAALLRDGDVFELAVLADHPHSFQFRTKLPDTKSKGGPQPSERPPDSAPQPAPTQ
jgi:hypothetical protein